MENAHRRKKQPGIVRRALLDHAARLVVEEGLAAVTVQAVSDAAGVTKGGFMHHFPSKQALITAVFEDLLGQIDRDLDARMAGDPEPWGSFTRAYVEAVLDMVPRGDGGPLAALSLSWLTDAGLRTLWADWFAERLRRHDATDGAVSLAVVRLAADGLWLSDLAGIAVADCNALRRHLVEATRPA
ncbi:TetR/AcrR family transcriptional regulator [Aureimonas sp. AU12]|uniref:TetR/AcrR family transcriptional regulator n=1 Tax=Aureimonas sp. AU12 TaxID=1638161 RepID=UPI0007820260|nr:TetR/AcrR family transcriptional regulator [Aureimonas sp. AU12]